MELTLQRTDKRKRFTLGTLSIAGEPFCDTLEPTWRDIGPGGKGRKVLGKTAIPEGRYPLMVTRSPQFNGEWLPLLLHVPGFAGNGEWLPLLLHVPGFAGIRIHAGNTVEDTAGCILVGYRPPKQTERLYDSRLWLHRLLRRLAERPEGEGVWITVE